jgi:hypothetical protein
MNVMIDGIRYVPELAQSKDEGLQTALEAASNYSGLVF